LSSFRLELAALGLKASKLNLLRIEMPDIGVKTANFA
jgi:hypothetical protein